MAKVDFKKKISRHFNLNLCGAETSESTSNLPGKF